MGKYDVVIVGGGHNGLTAAAYLAKAGKTVLVLERRPIVGGAAVTEEFHPGYRDSSCSYVASMLHPEVIRDLSLERFGLTFLPITSSFSPKPDGKYLLLTGDDVHDEAEVKKFSDKDWQGMIKLHDIIDQIADFIRPMLLKPPLQVIEGTMGILDMFEAGKAGIAFRRLSPNARYRMAQFLTSSVRQIVERYIESEELRTIYYSSSTAGSMASLDQAGSALNLLHLSLGEINGIRGEWAFARGGMGAISQSIADSAIEQGAEIRTNAGVKNIIIEQNRVTGVELNSGEKIRADIVMSSCEPKVTFLKLIEDKHLDPEFLADISDWRTESGTIRLSLALRELPDFTCLPGSAQSIHHESHISLKPSTAMIDRAWMKAKVGELPDEPIITLVIPSTLDNTLAPEGHHIMSVFAQHFPYQLSNGRSWDDHREQVANLIVDTIAKYAPNLKDSIIARQVLTPLDLEREYGLTGGDVYHGKMELDQIFSMRPHPSCANYRTPVKNLYLCGAGSHPGGGVSGLPGRNAAKAVLRDL